MKKQIKMCKPHLNAKALKILCFNKRTKRKSMQAFIRRYSSTRYVPHAKPKLISSQ